jgi:hypothetical protein
VAQQDVLRHQLGPGADGRSEQREEEQQALDHRRHDRGTGPEQAAGLLDPDRSRGSFVNRSSGASTAAGIGSARRTTDRGTAARAAAGRQFAPRW